MLTALGELAHCSQYPGDCADCRSPLCSDEEGVYCTAGCGRIKGRERVQLELAARRSVSKNLAAALSDAELGALLALTAVPA
jgi:hypothetical protein